jgi:hypothetical protein
MHAGWPIFVLVATNLQLHLGQLIGVPAAALWVRISRYFIVILMA